MKLTYALYTVYSLYGVHRICSKLQIVEIILYSNGKRGVKNSFAFDAYR